MSAASLYIPASNAHRWGEVPWTELPADFGDAGWVELRTTGQVSWTINSATYAVNSGYCNGSNAYPYYGEGSVGGGGDASGNLRMRAVVSSAAPADDDYGAVMVKRGDQVYRLSAAWSGARLYAKRSGLPGVCNGSPWYNFTGEHTVEVVKVTPVQVMPNKPEFLPGEVLTWTTRLYEGITETNLQWTFERTDGVVNYPSCSSSTCQYAPKGPGRMKVAGKWEIASPTVHVHNYSPLVTVQPPRLVLNCPTSVQRGSNMTCSAMGQGGALSNVVWTFTPDGAAQAIAGPTGTTSSWGGTLVTPGVMRVTAHVGGIPKDTSSRIEITDRGWRWGAAQWSFSHGTAPVPTGTTGNQEWSAGSPVLLGWNCDPRGCGTLRRVQPDIVANSNAGYTAVQVQTGPNTGYWYVESVTYGMNRATALNPTLLSTAPKRLLAEPQATTCRTAMNLPPTTAVWVNQYEFNEVCMNHDMDAAIQGFWNHEEWGTGTNNGHEAQARFIAGQLQYDPWHHAENVVSRDELLLRNEVFNRVSVIQNYIHQRSNDHSVVTGNWSGQLWIWTSTVDQFVLASVTTP